MATKQELESRESQCVSVEDWIQLANQALEKPSDPQYAEHLAIEAEMQCMEPGEYVSLATFLALKMDDTDNAEELLEQAEDACFTGMEFAQVGDAYAVLFNDKQKAIALIRDAVGEASGNELITLAAYAANAGDNTLAQSLIAKTTANFNQFSQFQVLAKQLVEAGNTPTAKTVLLGAERYLETVEHSVDFAKSMIDLFNDTSQAQRILDDAEFDCQFPSDFVVLAKGILETLNDEDKVDELLEEAAFSAMEGEEFLDVGNAFWDLKKDEVAAREYFEKALPELSDRSVLQQVAAMLVTELGDSDLAKQYYRKIAEKITNPNDLTKLATETWTNLNDREFAQGLFNRAESKLFNARDLVALAEAMVSTIGDEKSVLEIYRRAGDSIQNFTGLQQILESLKKSINDEKVTAELVGKMRQIANSTTELIQTCRAAHEVLDDQEIIHSILESAEELVSNPTDLELILKTVSELYSDNVKWQERLKDKLERRRANQAKYAEIQRLEKQNSTAVDTIRLGHRVVIELDDASYARSLFDRATDQLEANHFDVSQWVYLIKHIAADLKEEDLVRELVIKAASSSSHFSSAFQLARSVVEDLNPPGNTELAWLIVNEWDLKMSSPMDRVKLMRMVLELFSDRNWVIRNLKDCKIAEFDFLLLSELGKIASQVGDQELARSMYFAAVRKCTNTTELSQLIQSLKSQGAAHSLCKDLYVERKGSFEDTLEKLRWVEGILTHFGDVVWAKQEYKELQPEISGETMRAVFHTSRKHQLARRYY